MTNRWISASAARVLLQCGSAKIHRLAFKGLVDWRLNPGTGEPEFLRDDVMRAAKEQPR